MVKKITVHGIRRREPDVRSFVLALLELAREHVESDASNPANEKRANEYQTSRLSTREDFAADGSTARGTGRNEPPGA